LKTRRYRLKYLCEQILLKKIPLTTEAKVEKPRSQPKNNKKEVLQKAFPPDKTKFYFF
jgi:hypothetical protein